jgi:hypothetical protein
MIKAGCVPNKCYCYIADLNWDLLMEIPLSHSFTPSEEAFLGKMDKQARL